LTAEDPSLPTRSDQHLFPKTNQAGGAALQTGKPVFRSAPPAKMVVGAGQGGCRSTVDAVRAEEGAESGIEALAEGAVYLDKTGTIAPSDPDQGSSGLFAKALGWVRNTFEGVKRGVGLALAATRAGISEELTAARANLFNAFEPKLQSALRHLLKAETGHKSLGRDKSDPEHDPSDDFEP
jgi:hypothetical protein